MQQLKIYASLLLLAASINCVAESNQPPGIACLVALADKPELSILKGKMLTGTTDGPTFEMMANTKKPTKKEKVAIALLVSDVDGCIHQGDEWRAKNWPPSINAVYDQHVIAIKALTADLYAGTVTYGNYEQSIAASNAKFKADISEIVEKIKADQQALEQQQAKQRQQQAQDLQRQQQEQDARNLAIQQQNDQARRGAVLQFLSQQQQSQQNLYQQQMNAIRSAAPTYNPPVQTNCYTNGNMTNCTSR